jgi:site-specific recombinase XerD
MPTHNPENERIKRSYFIYLKEAKRLSEHSIDAAAAALSRFEEYTKYRDFKRFHIQQAVGFKRKLADQVSPRTGDRLASSTMFVTLNALRAFFHWLAGQPGYRSQLTYADADYFALSEKEARVVKARLERPVPTIEQILHVVRTMPCVTEIDLRNRAVIAFTLLTGARDALSLPSSSSTSMLPRGGWSRMRVRCAPSSPRPSRPGSFPSGRSSKSSLPSGLHS